MNVPTSSQTASKYKYRQFFAGDICISGSGFENLASYFVTIGNKLATMCTEVVDFESLYPSKTFLFATFSLPTLLDYLDALQEA